LWTPVGSGEVLIISSGVGDSARYRSIHYKEELEEQGFNVARTVQDNPFLPRYASRFNVFIFQNTVYTGSIKKFLQNIKDQNKTFLFETDDLLFDEKYFSQIDYLNQITPVEKLRYGRGVGREILEDAAIAGATTSTPFLAKKLREKVEPVFLVRNKLSKEDIAWTKEIYAKRDMLREKRKLVIGYFSGTVSHNKDFATVVPALQTLLLRYPNLYLKIAGYLDVHDEFVNKCGHKILRAPFVDRKKHFENIASVDINLAPLEYGKSFCEAKSELKFVEAGAVGVPTVAVATHVYTEVIHNGTDGFTAGSTQEWEQHIRTLVEDQALRTRMGEAARAKVLSEYVTTAGGSDELYQFLQKHIPKKNDTIN
jgi:glycosyltransferase involved in cell wall biosynthesis